MTWRDLGTFSLTNDWQFTPIITSSIVRITHLNVVNSLNIRGLIAQAISEDISFFDMRSFRQRTEKEVFLMLNFEGLLVKKLAIRRTDLTDVDWNIRIEELEGVSDINLPLGIADVSGLQAALSGKANTNHQHQITDVTGLEAELSEKAIALDVEAALLGKASTNHQHAIDQITDLESELSAKSDIGHNHQLEDVFGLESVLFSISSTLGSRIDAKADQSFVNPAIAAINTALLGKASTSHQHAIVDVTGLETALSEKAIALDVEAALLGKADAQHQHAIVDVTGLTDEFNSLTNQIDNKAESEHQHLITDLTNLIPIYTSSAPLLAYQFPDGTIWHETEEDATLQLPARIKKTWVKKYLVANNGSGDLWISLDEHKIDYFGPSSGIAGTASYHLPLDDRYNYLFKDYLVHCIYNTGTVDSTNYWRAIITTQPTGSTFANSGPIPNDNLSKRFAINQLFVPAAGERLIFNPQKFGAAPNAKIAMSLTYHLVRK